MSASCRILYPPQLGIPAKTQRIACEITSDTWYRSSALIKVLEHEEKMIQRGTDHWDIARGGGRNVRQRRSVRRTISISRRPTTRGRRRDSEGWKSAKFYDQENSEDRGLRGSSVWWPTRRCQIHYSQRGPRKKVVSPSARRRAVKMSVQEGIGKVAEACRALGLSRSSFTIRGGRSSLESRRIRKEVLELSAKHPRYGYQAHYCVDAAGRVRGQWETRGAYTY